MSRTVTFAIALCALAFAAPGVRGQFFDEGLSRLPSPDDPAAQIQPEVVAPGPAAPANEGKVILEEPGWHVWSPAFWDPWEGSVELGMNGTEGNSETFNVRFGMTAKHKTPTFVQTLQITSIQKSADGIVTANTALVDGRLEWPMPESRWNYFIHGLWEYDEFKAFHYRVSGDTGLGYEFIQTDVTTLMGRSGVSVSHEVGGPENMWNPELLLGGELKHKFNPTHSISGKVDYYPTVTDWSNFRLNSQASWEIALSAAWGLSLKFSVIDRYDSTPEGARPNDLDYSTLLLWTF
jgi:putative salt-induced outer membrane protein YdiY